MTLMNYDPYFILRPKNYTPYNILVSNNTGIFERQKYEASVSLFNNFGEDNSIKAMFFDTFNNNSCLYYERHRGEFNFGENPMECDQILGGVLTKGTFYAMSEVINYESRLKENLRYYIGGNHTVWKGEGNCPDVPGQ